MKLMPAPVKDHKTASPQSREPASNQRCRVLRAESIGLVLIALAMHSLALYPELDLVTAKPAVADRTRAPHHLFGAANPAEPVTASEYARRARHVLSEISSRHKLPIVAGGTGLYLRALLEGLFAGPQ